MKMKEEDERRKMKLKEEYRRRKRRRKDFVCPKTYTCKVKLQIHVPVIAICHGMCARQHKVTGVAC